VPWEKVSDYGVVVTDDDNRVVSFQEKPARDEARSNFASTGIYLFEPQVLDLIPADTVFDIGSDLFPLLVERGLPFYAQKRAYDWIDIGSVTDYWSVLQSVLLGEVAQLDVPGVQIADGLWVGLNTRIEWEGTSIEGPVYIGSGSHIEAGGHIVGPTWIGHGSHVCAGAQLVRSVLFEYTRISPGACVDEKIVFKEYSVDRAGGMSHVSEFNRSEWGNARDRRTRPRSGVVDEVKAA
jgi:mannose-1-phosphate guanylyltransferase